MTRQEITAFYNKHYKRLYNASMRIICNRFEAEEIMQDTIIKFLDTDNVPCTSSKESLPLQVYGL